MNLPPLPLKLATAVLLLVAMLLSSGCASIKPYRFIGPPESVVQDHDGNAELVYAGLDKVIGDANQPGADRSKLPGALVTEAMGVVEYNCTRYFIALGRASQDLSFTRKETSLVGSAVAAMLGLANQTPKFIANTAASFGLVASSMDSYQDTYLFSPDVESVRDLVTQDMKAYREQVTQPKTIGDAISTIAAYEAKCQPANIHKLVTTSVQKTVAANATSDLDSLQVDPTSASVAFADQGAGTSSGTKVVTVTNASKKTVTMSFLLTMVSGNTGSFAALAPSAGSCTPTDQDLKPGGKCTIELQFRPNATGDAAAAVRIFADSGSGKFKEIKLSGKGT